MSLFLSSCFSFQTKADLVLVKFYYNAAVPPLLKTYRKHAGKRLWWKVFLESSNYSKLTQIRTSFYRFSKLIFMVASKHWTETISFEWQHHLVEILQSHQKFVKKWKLFLIKCPKILRRKTFLFSLSANFTYFLKGILVNKKKKKKKKENKKKKRSMKLTKCLCKDKSSLNFLKSLV